MLVILNVKMTQPRIVRLKSYKSPKALRPAGREFHSLAAK